MTLNELATRLGVETHDDKGGTYMRGFPRPALDIAHECLEEIRKATPEDFGWRLDHYNSWSQWFITRDDGNPPFQSFATFPQAVCELGARLLQEQP